MQTPLPVLVINLERRLDRLNYISKHLQSLNINEFTVIKATDGKLLTAEEINKIHDTEASLKVHHEPMSLAQIACSHSHLRCYEKIVNEGLPYALILEDDIILSPQLFLHLNQEWLNEQDFDWLQIDYLPVGWFFFSHWLKSSFIQIKRKPLFIFYFFAKLPYIITLSLFEWLRNYYFQSKNIVKSVYFARPLYLASAYIITQTGAQKLLKLNFPITHNADMLPNRARITTDFKMRALSPLLTKQNKSLASDIENNSKLKSHDQEGK